MRTIKKWLSALLCLTLLLGALPAAALAADGTLTRAELAWMLYDKFRPASGGEEADFGDLDECGAEQVQAIEVLASLGIVSGTTANLFVPGGNATRWQVAVVLYRAMTSGQGSSEATNDQAIFDDVTEGYTYLDPENNVINDGSAAGARTVQAILTAVNYLVDEGVLTLADAAVEEEGAESGAFRPNALVTVGELETWLARAKDQESSEAVSSGSTDRVSRADISLKVYRQFQETLVIDEDVDPKFADIDGCSAEQQGAIIALAKANVLNGTSVYVFDVDGVVTYGQAALTLCRMLDIEVTAEEAVLEQALSALADVGIDTTGLNAEDLAVAAAVQAWLDCFTTRAEMAELLYDKFLPGVSAGDQGFADIYNCTAGQQAAINALAAAGIVSGSGSGTYAPDGRVNRAQTAIAIWRAAGAEEAAEDQDIFNDITDAMYGGMLAKAVNALAALGLLTAEDAVEGDFNPEANAAPADVSGWLGRLKLYTVTFNANGGTVSPGSAQTDSAGKLASLPTPSRSGSYRFAGWFTQAEGGNPVSEDTVFSGNTTIYAHWTYTGGSSSSGSSSSSSGNKTETERNPDGSTTTTVTRPNGTVTETTKNPDGSQEVVETKRDGTVTTTTTDADGNRTEVIENPDGSSETTIRNRDGSSSTTTVSKDGAVETAVKLPASVINDADGEAIALPMPEVSASADWAEAPAVTVNLPANTSAKAEIPVERVSSGTVAVLVKADGSEEVIKTSLATENGVAVTLSDGDTVKIVDNSKFFADVPASYWGAEAVDFASSRELFSGTGETTFSPDTAMDRGMLVTVLYRLENEPGVGSGSSYADVAEGVYYADAVAWADANGVVTGYEDATFAPARAITREEMAVVLYRYAHRKGYDTTPGGMALREYADYESISEYALEAMAWANAKGLITGDGGTLNPQGAATRAQVATIFMRFIQLTNG